MENLRLEYRSAAELEANPKNWRKHPTNQIDALRDVIGEVGWAGACLYNEATGRLIDGHARKKIAGDEKIPVLIGSWSEEQEAKILATLDPLAAMAETDTAALDSLLREVQTGSEAIGNMLDQMAQDAGLVVGQEAPEIIEDEPQLDRAEELRKEWGVESGQLWELGDHRLLCGDSTKREDVERVMGGEKADLCFTSPPYGQQRDYRDGATEKVSDWDSLMQGVFSNLPMAEAGQVLVNLGLIHRDGEWVPYWDGWINWMRQQGWRRFGWYVWDQGSGLPGDWNGRLAPSHEWVFHFNQNPIRPAKSIPIKEESRKKGKADAERLAKGKFVPGMRGKDGKVVKRSSAGQTTHKIPDSVIRQTRHVANDIARENHPATFSVAFSSAIVLSWPGTVYEPFSGSGTTLIACEQLSRKCRAIEISPAYVAVALQRWADLTGRTPTLSD